MNNYAHYALVDRECTIIVTFDDTNPDGTHWWTDVDVTGKAFVDGDTLVIGPIKVSHAACHYPDDHPNVVAERAAHAAAAAALPQWMLTAKVTHWTELAA